MHNMTNEQRQSFVEKWLTAGEKVLAKREMLKSFNETPETSAYRAFMMLYYHIAELSVADVNKYARLINKRKANISDREYKLVVDNFFAQTIDLFGGNEASKKETVAFMQKEGMLPVQPTEREQKRQDEQERKRREEADRRRRAEEEQRRREYESARRRNADRKSSNQPRTTHHQSLWSKLNDVVINLGYWFEEHGDLASGIISYIVAAIPAIAILVGIISVFVNEGIIWGIIAGLLGIGIGYYVVVFTFGIGAIVSGIFFKILRYVFYNIYVLLAIILLPIIIMIASILG